MNFIKIREAYNGQYFGTLLNLDNVEAITEDYYGIGTEVQYVGGQTEIFRVSLEEFEALLEEHKKDGYIGSILR